VGVFIYLGVGCVGLDVFGFLGLTGLCFGVWGETVIGR